MTIGLRRMDGGDAEAVAAFLSTNRFPFHVNPSPTEAQARSRMASGHFWSEDAVAYAILRTDWEDNTVTPPDFDDFASKHGLQKQGSTR